MSGGSLNYFYSDLESHANDLGDRELDDLVKDLANLFHDREWYLSGDYGEGDWNEARDAFKEKWFTQHGREERIEKYLSDLADEVRESLSISHKYCRDCKHWTIRGNNGYGNCEFQEYCSSYKCDSCEKWEAE